MAINRGRASGVGVVFVGKTGEDKFNVVLDPAQRLDDVECALIVADLIDQMVEKFGIDRSDLISRVRD